MATLNPFPAVRPVKNKVCLVPSYSYDRYSQLDINRMIKYNPYTFLNIIAKPYVRHLEPEKRHKAIKKLYNKFKKKRIYIQDSMPFYYVVRITDENGTTFTGITGVASTQDYEERIINKHEQTLANRVNLFTNYLYDVRINAEPVLLAHETAPALKQIYDEIQADIPEYEFARPDGKVFEVWPVSASHLIQEIKKIFNQIPAFYIADGHHRVESSYQLAKRLQAENPYHTGLEAYNYFLAFLIDYTQLKLYPYNRGVKKLKPYEPEDFLEKLKNLFQVEPVKRYMEPERGEFILYLCKNYYKVKIPSGLLQEGKTEVEIINDEIFNKILSISDVRNSKLITYCDGKTNIKCLTRKINHGECKAGFFVPALTFNEIKAKADRGETLPPKSSYIEPKLLSGLFVYEI